MTSTSERWIDLEGAENVRDLGGLTAAGGATIRPGRLIRADSLQDLSDADVRRLVDDLHVTAVADLRTGVEVAGEGPGPMTREPAVDVQHHSLFIEPEDGVQVSDDDDKPIVLPWKERERQQDEATRRPGVSGIYLGYLDDRPDSVLASLRLIAQTDGATIVHCAAGKDRTGTVVAVALAEVGVSDDDIVDDYALSAERVEAIIARLVTRRTYAEDLLNGESVDDHKPKPESMRRLLSAIDAAYGGVPAWLRANGWTEDDAAALRAKLLD